MAQCTARDGTVTSISLFLDATIHLFKPLCFLLFSARVNHLPFIKGVQMGIKTHMVTR